ncbi:MAG: hypothetical protein AAB354_16820 [candidate division KSB1 bacterium]
MQFKVTPTFARALKKLRKKYRKIDQDIAILRTRLELNPTAGIPLGTGLFKIRLASSDMTKGKSGALRVVYFWRFYSDMIVLLDLYTKNETENIPVSELRKLLEDFLNNNAA